MLDKSLRSLKDTLNSLGVVPSKSRGQNFLYNTQIVQQIVEFAEIEPQFPLIEIGPGLGILSREIIAKTSNVWLIEIDRRFCKYLGEELKNISDSWNPEERIVCKDIRLVDPGLLLADTESKAFVIGNVPYSISSEVIFWILDNRSLFSGASLLLQQEFAERIASAPNSKAYGILSVLVGLWAEITLGTTISGTQFWPKAQVDSRLLKLRLRDKPLVDIPNFKLFTKIVRSSFATRRKTLLNNITNAGFFESKEYSAEILKSLAIDPGRRAETLTIKEFAEIAFAVDKAGYTHPN